MRCGDPYFGQQQAFVLLPECEAGGRRIRECLCGGQPEYLYRAGLSGAESGQVAADGLPPRNITMRLQSLAKRVELSFVLDRLDFMAKSGRCSGVLAFGAKPAGHQARTGSDRRRAEGSQKNTAAACPSAWASTSPTVWWNATTSRTALCSSPPASRSPAAWSSEGGAEEIRQLQGMPRDRHRHHHRRLFRPGYHWHRVCTEGKIKKWLLHMRQPLFLTGSGVLKFHPEWHRPHRPCSSAAAHGCCPG